MVFVVFPLEATNVPQDVKMLYQKVEDMIQKQITSITTPQTSGEDNSANSISFVLFIKTLIEVLKDLIDPYILVSILQREKWEYQLVLMWDKVNEQIRFCSHFFSSRW